MISESEMMGFNAAITVAGFDPYDFYAVVVDDKLPSAEPFAIISMVTVNRKSTADATTYPIGHGSTWVADFEYDLNFGKFGKP